MPEITPNEPNHAGSMGIDVDALAESFAEKWESDRGQVGDADSESGDQIDTSSGTGDDSQDSGDQADATAKADAGQDDSQAGADAGDGEQGDADTHRSTPAPAITSLAVPLHDGSQFELTVDGAQSLLALAGWAESLTPDQREAFTAIERGQAVAIPRAEFEQFQAWQQIRARQQQPAATDDYLDDLDPEIAARIRAEQQELARYRQQQYQPSPADYSHAQAELQARVQAYNSGVQQWAEARGITDTETIEQLSNVAVSSGVIAQFVDRRTVRNPVTGDVLQPADLTQVAADAMNFALATNPELHSEVLTRQTQASQPASTEPSESDRKVAAKKARAASVASAPSTAVPSPSGQPNHDILQTIPAMAEAIARRINGDGS